MRPKRVKFNQLSSLLTAVSPIEVVSLGRDVFIRCGFQERNWERTKMELFIKSDAIVKTIRGTDFIRPHCSTGLSGLTSLS